MSKLKLLGIKKRFGQTVALDCVDLTLQAGSVHALIGENGAGKSTLMNVISGSVRPDEGAMSLNGRPYQPADPLAARKNRIAFIRQELSLAPHLSVAENILLGIEGSRFGWLSRTKLEQKALSVLENFHHPDIRPEMSTGLLSPAAQQVVEICRAVAANAEIILMDEPTSSLQREDVDHLFALVRNLKANGISIIYISHFLEEVREIADEFTVLRDGRSAANGVVTDVTDEFLVLQMVGRQIENVYPRRARSQNDAPVLLDVKDVASRPALKSASFSIRGGEIFGIAGLMGAGRTELVRAVFGIDSAASGTIAASGKVLTARGATPARRMLDGLGFLSEDRKGEGLALGLSIADNVTITRFATCSRYGFLDLAKQRKQSEELTEYVGVKMTNTELPVRTLSGGNQQKVAFARLLHQDADILLLDEPTRGIDIGSKVRIYETIAGLAGRGKAILMVSSYLPELFGMCDRLAVMSRGVLSPSRPIGEWTPESVLQTAIGAAANS